MNRLIASALLAVFSSSASAQTTGYSSAASIREKSLEAALVSRASADTTRQHSRALSAKPHMAGTEQQAWTRDYVIGKMKSWGLETSVREYTVWMPHAVSVRAWRVTPNPVELSLLEGRVAEDTTSWSYPQVPTFNGSGAAGDVTGEIVYVNYGLIEDYAQLDSMGVSLKGKIAIARYGKSFRGIKAREAEKHGAIGLIIYSDPANDGYTRGDTYPAGPFRPSQGVQRGSVQNMNGDPSTPGYPSVAGAVRIAPEKMLVPHIPVIPMSYGNASQLLSGVGGKNIPEDWQGGLPFRYHVGPGPVVARLELKTDVATHPFKKIWDTFGVIRGSEFPDELIIIGGHRDAWGPGAQDNISGTTSVLEAARIIAAEAKAGRPPRRTIIFATWDAEEWGLVGSTEFVEEDSVRLAAHAVAYLNQDAVVGGASFGGGGSPSLRALLRDVTKHVPDPAGGTVYAEWRKNAKLDADTLEPPSSEPGGGSDFAGFYNHLGIPLADWGFGSSGGIYHSAYDSYHWMSTFGDSTYAYHKTTAAVAALTVSRLANADIVPFDYEEFAATIGRMTSRADSSMMANNWKLSIGSLSSAIEAMRIAASQFARERDSYLSGQTSAARSASVNEALRGVERELTRPAGLVTRPWFRGVIYAADEDNGYSTMTLPSINEAIRKKDRSLTAAEITDMASRFAAATTKLEKARSLLSGH